MFLQIVAEYPGLGDMRLLTDSEIRYFYNGIRRALQKRTKKS